MSCYHPLPAIKKPFDNTFRVGKYGDSFQPYVDYQTGELIDQISVPCGKCIGCRLDYSRAWADRCVLESLDYPEDHCWFVTLTYDDNHLVTADRSIVSDKGTLTLYPRDVQLFIKRLREHWSRVYGVDRIRFFMCGEYGSTTARPHYHLLLYNLPIQDLKYYTANLLGDLLYNSDELSSLWGLGFVVIGKFEWKTAAYTARYVLKKFKGQNKEETREHYEKVGLYPEYTRMSRKPGIGRDYLDRHAAEIYKNDEIILAGGRVSKPPKYFDKIMKDNDEVLMTLIKDARKKVAALKNAEVFNHTNLDEDAYFKISEISKEKSIKSLTRLL